MSLFLTATLNQSLGTLTFVIAICVSGLLALNNKLTLGSMMGIIQLTNSMVFPLSQIATAKNEMNSVTSIVDNFANNKIYDWWITKYNNKTKIFNFENIKINDLNFSYDSNKHILNNMNLCIEKNKKYAIIGESGTGKSTLAKILSGHISNYNGSIKVNSKELSTIDKKDYHRICRYVKQQPYLFKDTLENNIKFYRNTSDEDLSNAISLCNISNLYNEKKDDIIDDTNGLSGGQKQRISLARALIEKPQIIILDEPTSSLDYKNTKEILQSLLNLDDITLIVITHIQDKKILEQFDEIISI